MPQVSEADDSFLIAPACDISGSEPCADRSYTRKSLPRVVKSKIKVSGISLQATTADSSSHATAVSSESMVQASDRSLAKAKEVKKPSPVAYRWIYIIIAMAIAVAVIYALLRYRSSIWSVVRFVLRKVIT